MTREEEFFGEPLEVIVDRAKKGSVEDFEKIYSYSMPGVKAISLKYFIPGAERDDLIQEGTLGVLSAVLTYDSEKEASFKTYMEILVERRIIKAVVRAGRKKHTPLNNALSISADEENQGIETYTGDGSLDPQEILGETESFDAFSKLIEEKLSETEIEVLNEYLSGKSYEMIAKALGRDVKSVDNALQRARRKLKAEKG